MARINVKLEGTEEVQRALRLYPGLFLERFVQQLERQAPAIQREIARRVPADSGELRMSATAKRVGDALVVGYTAKYAPFVYYRRRRFGAATVRQTLAKYRRTRHLRGILRGAAARAADQVASQLGANQ